MERVEVISNKTGEVREGVISGYLTSVTKWRASGQKQGKPGIPTASNQPTLYAATFSLDLDELDLRQRFIRLKVYTGSRWVWIH